MAATHITEAEAIRDFAGILARVRAGEELIIQAGTQPVAVIRPAVMRIRTISESIARSEERIKTLGYDPVIGPDFADDLEEIVRNRRPRATPEWD